MDTSSEGRVTYNGGVFYGERILKKPVFIALEGLERTKRGDGDRMGFGQGQEGMVFVVAEVPPISYLTGLNLPASIGLERLSNHLSMTKY